MTKLFKSKGKDAERKTGPLSGLEADLIAAAGKHGLKVMGIRIRHVRGKSPAIARGTIILETVTLGLPTSEVR